MSSSRRRRSSTEMARESASSSRDGVRPWIAVNCVARLGDVALPAAQRARRPVLPAQLVEHGAVDAGPRELLERGALGRVVAVDRGDQGLEAAGDEVLDLAARRQLADLLEDDVLHERREGHHEAIAHLQVASALVLAPERQRLIRGNAAAAGGRGGFMRDGLLTKRCTGLTDWTCIGPGPDLLDHRFGVIASSLTLNRPTPAPPRPPSTAPAAPRAPRASPASASASSGILVHRHPRLARALEDRRGHLAAAGGDDLRRPGAGVAQRRGDVALRHTDPAARAAASPAPSASRPVRACSPSCRRPRGGVGERERAAGGRLDGDADPCPPASSSRRSRRPERGRREAQRHGRALLAADAHAASAGPPPSPARARPAAAAVEPRG